MQFFPNFSEGGRAFFSHFAAPPEMCARKPAGRPVSGACLRPCGLPCRKVRKKSHAFPLSGQQIFCAGSGSLPFPAVPRQDMKKARHVCRAFSLRPDPLRDCAQLSSRGLRASNARLGGAFAPWRFSSGHIRVGTLAESVACAVAFVQGLLAPGA